MDSWIKWVMSDRCMSGDTEVRRDGVIQWGGIGILHLHLLVEGLMGGGMEVWMDERNLKTWVR